MHRQMLFVAQIFVALLLLVGGIAAFRDSVHRWRAKQLSRARFTLLIVAGLLVGFYFSVWPVWWSSRTTWLGAPLTVAVFQDGQDFVGPLTLPFAIVNFVIGLLLVHMPGWIIARRRRGTPATSRSP